MKIDGTTPIFPQDQSNENVQNNVPLNKTSKDQVEVYTPSTQPFDSDEEHIGSTQQAMSTPYDGLGSDNDTLRNNTWIGAGVIAGGIATGFYWPAAFILSPDLLGDITTSLFDRFTDPDWYGQAAKDSWEGIKDGASATWGFMENVGALTWDVGTSVVDDVIDDIKHPSNVTDWMGGAISDTGDAIKDGAEATGDFVENTVDLGADVATSAVDDVEDVFDDIW
ncbi:MAG TPA: hypothetical protein VFG11_04090 [Acidobacteriota bacterium]|nr:hypothetical protein [Acidobacteriota bacterium]